MSIVFKLYRRREAIGRQNPYPSGFLGRRIIRQLLWLLLAAPRIGNLPNCFVFLLLLAMRGRRESDSRRKNQRWQFGDFWSAAARTSCGLNEDSSNNSHTYNDTHTTTTTTSSSPRLLLYTCYCMVCAYEEVCLAKKTAPKKSEYVIYPGAPCGKIAAHFAR